MRQPQAVRARINTMQDFRVRKAIQLMKANVCERICFDDVARSVGLSVAAVRHTLSGCS